MNSILAFSILAAAAVWIAIISVLIYRILPLQWKYKIDDFFKLNEGGFVVMGAIKQSEEKIVKASYGEENKKPQIKQLYDDISMFLEERRAYQSALTKIQEAAANGDMDEETRNNINNIVLSALKG